MRISDWSSDVCSSDLDEGEPDSSAGVPVVKRLLLREQKTSSPFFREQHKNIGRMSIVAENEATIGELRLDALILSSLVIARVIAVIDKEVDGVGEACQGCQRVSVEDPANAGVRWLTEVAGMRIEDRKSDVAGKGGEVRLELG